MSHYTSQEATELMQSWIVGSGVCLDHLKIPREPTGKWKSWKVPGGPVGSCHHYTNGPNGLGSMRWFNHPGWGNKGSSCHVMIFDRLIKELEDLWPKQEIASVFKVPTLLHFDPAKGSWNCNWANSLCFGIENRNTGYSGYKRLKGGLNDLGKIGMVIGSRTYEEYWREQIEANIVIDRILHGWRGDQFDPKWIVAHSQIWCTKLDPGPLFPTMHEMRGAVFGGPKDASEVDWLARYDESMPAPDLEEDDEPETGDDRSNPPKTEQSWWVDPTVTIVPKDDDLPFVSEALYKLGWPTGPEILAPADLKEFVCYFQRSTLAWKYHSKPERVLKVDGIAGPKTQAAFRDQLKRQLLT